MMTMIGVMSINIEEQIIDLQQQIFNQEGIRTDAHIKEGVGVLFTPENAGLIPSNVILAIPYHAFMFGNINLN